MLGMGLHLWLIFVLVNIVIFYSIHFFIIGSTCMTKAQVASDSRCLYIWGNQVYLPPSATKANPHFGHPCGTDITSIIPASHVGSQARYLVPNYIANICTGNGNPTPTPTPKPTSTPTPTPKPTSTPTPAPKPTNTPTPAPQPTATPTPTPAPAATATPTPPQAQPTAPTNTPTPTSSAPATGNPIANVSFVVPGIGDAGGNIKPLQTLRNFTLFLYGKDVNTTDPAVQPLYTVNSQAQFDTNPASPTFNKFVRKSLDLGAAIPDGQYMLALSTDMALRKIISVLSISRTQPLDIPTQNLIIGDLNHDNKMDINDYNILVNCFGSKNGSATCSSNADLNDDGAVDGIDYNLMIRSFELLKQSGVPVQF